ncbi:hypothetical protein H4R24_003474 [Coemansia sp. RSA 988]|nr:hypothetical protein H4R24_003474 [Coemansia sp. RSA 988]
MSGRQTGTPVGSQGLTPVGSPNRVQRRTGQGLGTPQLGSPRTPLTESHGAPLSTGEPNNRSTFAERVYQSTGRINSRNGIGPFPDFYASSRDASAYTTPAALRGASVHSRDLASSTGSDLPDTTPSSVLSPGSLSRQSLVGEKSALRRAPPPKPPRTAASTTAEKGVQAPSSAIPAAVVDLPSQRLYALAILALLLAWKTYDAIGLAVDSGRTSFYLFVKWCLLDTALWYAGWLLHIPKMAVPTRAMYVLVAGSAFINLNLFFLSSSVLTLAVKPVAISVASSCLRSVKSIPWLGPRLVGDNDLLIDSFELDEEHILGRHTIHILPHSLAHMNPQGKCFCIDDARVHSEPWYWRYTSGILGQRHNSQTSIPILVNGTQPASITYVFTSFDTGQRQLRTVKNIGALQMEASAVYPTLGNWVMATYHLPINGIGAYEIYSVKDNKGLEFRTAAQAPQTIVVNCPRAKLQWRSDKNVEDSFTVGSDGHASICQRTAQIQTSTSETSDEGLIQVAAEGYEPMEMTIVRLVNGHREVINLDSILPQTVGDSVEELYKGLNETQVAAIEKWQQFRSRKSVYTISDTFLRPGEYVYKLEGIRDAANHSVALSNLGVKGVFDGEKVNESKATPYMARIQVYQRPSIGWADSLLNTELPLRISDDRQRKSQHALPLTLTGTGPWSVSYTVVDGADVVKETKTFTTAKGATIDAKRAGIYHLASVQDKHCAGHAEGTNISLVLAPIPKVNITATPITAHECGGEIGALIDLELAGRPPFAVHYRERNLRFPNSRPITRVVRSQQRRQSFKIMPELAGTYELEFFRLEDDNYPSGQPIATTIQQAIHAQPSAKLDNVSGRIPASACMGETLELPVRLKGQGPWELTYNVIYENRRTSKTITGIIDENYTIDLGAFEKPGDYTIELERVKDGNQCARDLLDVSTVINVREGGPYVGFKCPDGGVRVLDGEQALIPVHVVGEFPVDVRYHKVGDASEHVYKTTITRRSHSSAQADSVLAYGPGEYELVSTSDICAGTIDPQNARCSVHVEPKPSAWFVSDGLRRDDVDSHSTGILRLQESCEGAKLPGGFELGLSGSGPWKLNYRVDFWSASSPRSGVPGFTDRSQTHSLVALQNSALKPECCEPGLYRYTLISVSDERYQKPQALMSTHEAIAPDAGITVVEHVIASSPLAALRAYAPDGAPLDAAASRGTFRRKAPSIKYCLTPGQSLSDGDAQAWAKLHEHLPVFRIEFEEGGLAPYQAWVEVFPASGPSEVVHIRDIEGLSQSITLPEHVTSQIGRYHMRLVKTRDARGCEHQFVDPNEVGLGRPDHGGKAIAGGIEIEYIEAPNARPATSSPSANPSRDVCVGDVLSFDLRGLNSWNVEYTYNSARRTTTANKRLFRRVADVPGNFTLTRLCHRSANDCCSEFDDLSYSVHDIPRVRVSGGKDVHQDILEGDLVDIKMDLVGTPPFTFTWQRRSFGGGPGSSGKILESHTVKDLDSHAYTISTSSEGTFEVTYVQDRYCQYPKA